MKGGESAMMLIAMQRALWIVGRLVPACVLAAANLLSMSCGQVDETAVPMVLTRDDLQDVWGEKTLGGYKLTSDQDISRIRQVFITNRTGYTAPDRDQRDVRFYEVPELSKLARCATVEPVPILKTSRVAIVRLDTGETTWVMISWSGGLFTSIDCKRAWAVPRPKRRLWDVRFREAAIELDAAVDAAARRAGP